jgi:hypothetical protein
MHTTTRLLSLFVILSVLAGGVLVYAQDATTEAGSMITCDSTLVTLLLVAEHDYDYLSAKMDMGEEVPAIDYGQYGPVIDAIVAMMMQMQDEAAMATAEAMTEEQMAAHDQMLTEMMTMDTAGMVASYMSSMNMTMEEGTTTLTPGNVANEDPVCAEVRADVEKFILAHILTEMSMMSGM